MLTLVGPSTPFSIKAARGLLGMAVVLLMSLGLAPGASAGKPADLRVTKLSSPPASATPGGQFSATDSTKNFGSKKASSSKTKFYLSTDGRLSSSDPVLQGSRTVPALKKGKTSKGPTALTIPFIVDGSYSIIACADAADSVDEQKEKNNCRVSNSQVTVAEAAEVAVGPLDKAFDPVTAGSASAPTTFTVSNTGGATTGALAVSRTGTDASQFQVVTDGCAGITLPPGGTCEVDVSFAPSTAGAKSASLTVMATPGGGASATLTGTGLTPNDLSATPADRTFDPRLTGTSSGPQSFTITNTGSVPTGPLATSLGGANANQFEIGADDCVGKTLAPNATCTIELEFSPDSRGAKSASLVVSGTPGGTATASLTGTGLAPAHLTITPATHDFGSVVLGTTSAPFTWTVTNDGDVSTSAITDVTKVGAGADSFLMEDNCTAQVLAAAGTCTIRLRFAPTSSTGVRSMQLFVTAAVAGTASSEVSGTGT